jgi:putative photosynthetic complex assembly protein 2
MSRYGFPIAYTLFAWWFATGLIIYLDRLPRHTHRWSMGGATALLALAFYGLAETRDDPTVGGAYLAFTCTLLVWGWQEIAFLLGWVTGPRKDPCPDGARPTQRFGFAVQTILYHEFALIVLGTIVFVATYGAPNAVGAWTFAVLWVMRLSAKLNLFLGVRNWSEDLLPEHLRYLQSYFMRRPMNLLFPVAVTAATIAAAFLWAEAFAAAATPFEATAMTFVGALLTLAILEHWFLVLPLPTSALWLWGTRRDDAAAPLPVQNGLAPK